MLCHLIKMILVISKREAKRCKPKMYHYLDLILNDGDVLSFYIKCIYLNVDFISARLLLTNMILNRDSSVLAYFAMCKISIKKIK